MRGREAGRGRFFDRDSSERGLCPVCSSSDTRHSRPAFEGRAAFRDGRCADCGASWGEKFRYFATTVYAHMGD